MSMLKSNGSGNSFFRQSEQRRVAGYELAGVDVIGNEPFGRFRPDPVWNGAPKSSPEPFDIGALLRLRTFLYIIIITVLGLVQIYNTLAITELSKRNERLREQLRISSSITTAQELKAREIQSVRYISGFARQLGLESLAIPPVEIEQ